MDKDDGLSSRKHGFEFRWGHIVHADLTYNPDVLILGFVVHSDNALIFERSEMDNEDIKRAIQAGWDDMSHSYQMDTRITLEDVHYAPLTPGEREYGLLGDVRDKEILEIACGAAQNSIALAKWGARVTAIDISHKQLAVARNLVRQENVNVNLIRADAERLTIFKNSTFDKILSSFGWEFIPDLTICLQECFRVLRSGGQLVMSTVHPLTAFEWDESLNGLVVTDYFNLPVESWDHNSPKVDHPAMTFFRTIQETFEMLVTNNFTVGRILEPFPYQIDRMSQDERRQIPYSGDYWESQYHRLQKVPFAIIYVAHKPQ